MTAPRFTAPVRRETIPTPVVCAAFCRSGTQWLTRVLEDVYGDLVSARHEVAHVTWSRGIHAPRRVERPPIMSDRRVVCIGGAALDLLDAYAYGHLPHRLVHVRRAPTEVARSCQRQGLMDYALALRRWQEFDAAVREREPDATFRIEDLWAGELGPFVDALGLPRRDWSDWVGRVVDRRVPESARTDRDPNGTEAESVAKVAT